MLIIYFSCRDVVTTTVNVLNMPGFRSNNFSKHSSIKWPLVSGFSSHRSCEATDPLFSPILSAVRKKLENNISGDINSYTIPIL